MAGTHVALLRGLNLGGSNRLPMKELAALFVDAGCREVVTYIQSGNVVFQAGDAVAARIPAQIREAIAARYGFQVPIVTRAAAEMAQVVQSNPFLQEGADPAALHVVFLAEAPDAARVESLDPHHSPTDRFILRGRELYLHCPNGLARTKLTNDYFDRRLGTISTMRNWRTVLKLHELAGG
jgi:uncharacterized protein (DUF1697 family)